MEITKHLSNSEYILAIRGNSRFRILNDYENGLIDKKYMNFNKPKNQPINKYPTLYLHVYDYCGSLKKDNSKYMYILFKYVGKKAIVDLVWDFNQFTPSYVIYPISPIKDSTYKDFNITREENNIIFDNYESEKNNRIMDSEYIENRQDKIFQYHMLNNENDINNIINSQKKVINYPTMVCKYGEMIKLGNNVEKESI